MEKINFTLLGVGVGTALLLCLFFALGAAARDTTSIAGPLLPEPTCKNIRKLNGYCPTDLDMIQARSERLAAKRKKRQLDEIKFLAEMRAYEAIKECAVIREAAKIVEEKTGEKVNVSCYTEYTLGEPTASTSHPLAKDDAGADKGATAVPSRLAPMMPSVGGIAVF